MSTTTTFDNEAVLDTAHVGDIQGALGTITGGDVAARSGLRRKLITLAAIVGPGLIVMAGDNDAGAFRELAVHRDHGTRLMVLHLVARDAPGSP